VPPAETPAFLSQSAIVEGRDSGHIRLPVGPARGLRASAEMARSSVAARWADIGNLILHETTDPAQAMPALLSAAADWLLLGAARASWVLRSRPKRARVQAGRLNPHTQKTRLARSHGYPGTTVTAH
jgi:hypothetical protein